MLSDWLIPGKIEKLIKASYEPNIENLDSINYEVVKKICLRSEAGLKTYGTTMDREDLCLLTWLQHLQEEMLDACIYIEKVVKTIKDQSPPENPPQ